MNTLEETLRAADPLAREGGLSADAAGSMRKAVLAAGAARTTVRWNVAAPVAAALSAVLLAGVWTVHQGEQEPASRTVVDEEAAASTGELRQMFFATAGGTRVVWVFNQDFELR